MAALFKDISFSTFDEELAHLNSQPTGSWVTGLEKPITISKESIAYCNNSPCNSRSYKECTKTVDCFRDLDRYIIYFPPGGRYYTLNITSNSEYRVATLLLGNPRFDYTYNEFSDVRTYDDFGSETEATRALLTGSNIILTSTNSHNGTLLYFALRDDLYQTFEGVWVFFAIGICDTPTPTETVHAKVQISAYKETDFTEGKSFKQNQDFTLLPRHCSNKEFTQTLGYQNVWDTGSSGNENTDWTDSDTSGNTEGTTGNNESNTVPTDIIPCYLEEFQIHQTDIHSCSNNTTTLIPFISQYQESTLLVADKVIHQKTLENSTFVSFSKSACELLEHTDTDRIFLSCNFDTVKSELCEDIYEVTFKVTKPSNSKLKLSIKQNQNINSVSVISNPSVLNWALNDYFLDLQGAEYIYTDDSIPESTVYVKIQTQRQTSVQIGVLLTSESLCQDLKNISCDVTTGNPVDTYSKIIEPCGDVVFNSRFACMNNDVASLQQLFPEPILRKSLSDIIEAYLQASNSYDISVPVTVPYLPLRGFNLQSHTQFTIFSDLTDFTIYEIPILPCDHLTVSLYGIGGSSCPNSFFRAVYIPYDVSIDSVDWNNTVDIFDSAYYTGGRVAQGIAYNSTQIIFDVMQSEHDIKPGYLYVQILHADNLLSDSPNPTADINLNINVEYKVSTQGKQLLNSLKNSITENRFPMQTQCFENKVHISESDEKKYAIVYNEIQTETAGNLSEFASDYECQFKYPNLTRCPEIIEFPSFFQMSKEFSSTREAIITGNGSVDASAIITVPGYLNTNTKCVTDASYFKLFIPPGFKTAKLKFDLLSNTSSKVRIISIANPTTNIDLYKDNIPKTCYFVPSDMFLQDNAINHIDLGVQGNEFNISQAFVPGEGKWIYFILMNVFGTNYQTFIKLSAHIEYNPVSINTIPYYRDEPLEPFSKLVLKFYGCDKITKWIILRGTNPKPDAVNGLTQDMQIQIDKDCKKKFKKKRGGSGGGGSFDITPYTPDHCFDPKIRDAQSDCDFSPKKETWLEQSEQILKSVYKHYGLEESE